VIIPAAYQKILQSLSRRKTAYQNRFQLDANRLQETRATAYGELWVANPVVYQILKEAPSLENAREALFNYLTAQEKWLYQADNQLHALEKANTRQCISTFKHIIAPSSERVTRHSALRTLFNMAHGNIPEEQEVAKGFILEFIFLFQGVAGLPGIYSKSGIRKAETPAFTRMESRRAAILRSDILDTENAQIGTYTQRYPSGLKSGVIAERQDNRERILKFFHASENDWNNYNWQIQHVIRDYETLKHLIRLTSSEERSIQLATANGIPFGITPYYLSLMDSEPSRRRDRSVRMQVIPPLSYTKQMITHDADRSEIFDFMGEHDTSPVQLVTRRYPQIAIFKPYNTCAQICVYCQRNWEIDTVLDPNALASPEQIDTALDWFSQHPAIHDVLITGGDPLILPDDTVQRILDRIASFPHVTRIRIGTRTPVVLPQRFTDKLVAMLAGYYIPGQRDVALVTHIQHVWEVTPEVVEAVQKFRHQGMSVYNQSVFVTTNSRRFELVALRKLLKIIGVDPYYTFNAKGKDETREYRVPIARLLQERKEEARLLPGLDRTDEPVFNVPRLGKNHLRAGQDHRIIMITPEGRRIYEFLPWEKNIKAVPAYTYKDVSIYQYLKALHIQGEDINDYWTIWYYH
jgi:lysine 2,3-aminomutase